MPSNVISVNTFDKVDVKEDQKTEFKTSIFIDAETNAPGIKQMLKIARTLAAFMNADGGMLYVGVTDDKQIRGIADDLAILSNSPSSVAVHTVRFNDDGFTYGATEDKYELKLRAIAKAFLSPNAVNNIAAVLVRPMGGKPVCRIEVKPCNPDEFVYCFRKYGQSHVEVEDVYVRTGNQNTKLDGAARDTFVRKRVAAGFNSQLTAVRAAMSATGTHGVDAVLSSVRELLAKFTPATEPGTKLVENEGYPFTETAVTAAENGPKRLLWDGQHYAEVSGWQELVLKVLEKLQEINAAKFDELAAQAEFKKRLVTIQKAREKHPDCYPTKFGADGKVRVKKSLGGKLYLWREDMALRKIIAAFDVDVSKFMFVAE